MASWLHQNVKHLLRSGKSGEKNQTPQLKIEICVFHVVDFITECKLEFSTQHKCAPQQTKKMFSGKDEKSKSAQHKSWAWPASACLGGGKARARVAAA